MLVMRIANLLILFWIVCFWVRIPPEDVSGIKRLIIVVPILLALCSIAIILVITPDMMSDYFTILLIVDLFGMACTIISLFAMWRVWRVSIQDKTDLK